MSQSAQSDRNMSASAATCGPTCLRDIGLLLLLMIVVAAITFAVHRPVLDAQAVSFDDNETFLDSPLVQTPSWASVRQFFTEVTESSVVRGYYRPLTFTSLMLDWAMGGSATNFRPFHRTSLILHIASTLLVILLCYQIFGRPLIAAMVGLLFGVHPLTVEPIAWVMERKTILAAIFTFACLCAYVRYTHCGRWRWFVLAIVLFLLSLLAKPTGTPLPFILLLLDYWPLRRFNTKSLRSSPLSRLLLEKLPFLVLAVAFAALAYVCENSVSPLKTPIAQFPLRASWLVMFYLGKLVMPINLSSVYMMPDPLTLSNPAVLACVIGTIAFAAALVVSGRWTPAFWVGAAVLFVGLGPTMGLVHYSWVIASDKYVYLPAIGPLLVLAWLLGSFWSPAGPGTRLGLRRVCVVGVVAAAACALAVGTSRYLPKWKDSETLARYMLALAPNSGPVNYNWGSILLNEFKTNPAKLDQAKLDEAFEYYRKASEFDNDFAAPHYGMGWIHAVRGKTDEALEQFHLAIERKKDYSKAYIAIAQAYVTKNQPDRAIETLGRLLALRPQEPFGHQMLAAVQVRQGKTADAVATLTRAIEIIPNHPVLLLDLGNALLRDGRPAEAAVHFNQALDLRPDSAEAHFRLASALAQTGKPEEAVSHYAAALRLMPNPPISLRNDLAWTLATNKISTPAGVPSAVSLAESVCKDTQRKEPTFLDTLAAAYARDGRYKEAEQTAQEAIDLATSRGLYDMARSMDARRHLYSAGQAYDERAAIAASTPTP